LLDLVFVLLSLRKIFPCYLQEGMLEAISIQALSQVNTLDLLLSYLRT
jgi:hypothetical protein